jgi:PAS domain S-box-containing protein
VNSSTPRCENRRQSSPAFLSIAADAIISVDEMQRIVHFNHGAEEIFGFAAADILGKSLDLLIPARFRAAHPGHMHAFARSESTARRMGQRREIFGLRKDGTEFPRRSVHLQARDRRPHAVHRCVARHHRAQASGGERAVSSPRRRPELAVTLDTGTAVQTIADLPIPRLADACLVDVVQADGSLNRVASTWQKKTLTPALTALAALPIDWDSPAAVIDVMRRGVCRVGRRGRRLVGRARGTSRRGALARARRAARGHHSVHDGEAGARRAHLHRRRSRASLDGRHDETRREIRRHRRTHAGERRSLRRCARANRARDEVLGVVSHDLRNPLSAIAMCARALGSAQADRGQQLLTTITESTEWMNRLIQDLLDVANIDRGQLSLERRPESPRAMLDQAIHMFAMEAADQRIRLSSTLEPDASHIHVQADAARVVQVLGNLVRNAIKFTPDGGEVELSATRRGSNVVFSVRDTGRGISAEAQARVFDRYWHSRGDARTRGTGLGLSISKGIVEAHGGRIWVDSIEGQGSTFSFTLPVADTSEIGQPPLNDLVIPRLSDGR